MTGSERGLVTVYSMGPLGASSNSASLSSPIPLFTFMRNSASITTLAFFKHGLAVGTEDGQAYVVALNFSTPPSDSKGKGNERELERGGAQVVAELVGNGVNAVRVIRVRKAEVSDDDEEDEKTGEEVWVVGDDGFVRFYEI